MIYGLQGQLSLVLELILPVILVTGNVYYCINLYLMKFLFHEHYPSEFKLALGSDIGLSCYSERYNISTRLLTIGNHVIAVLNLVWKSGMMLRPGQMRTLYIACALSATVVLVYVSVYFKPGKNCLVSLNYSLHLIYWRLKTHRQYPVRNRPKANFFYSNGHNSLIAG